MKGALIFLIDNSLSNFLCLQFFGILPCFGSFEIFLTFFGFSGNDKLIHLAFSVLHIH